jgi:thiol-disulfide isomerase/thioredoxin
MRRVWWLLLAGVLVLVAACGRTKPASQPAAGAAADSAAVDTTGTPVRPVTLEQTLAAIHEPDGGVHPRLVVMNAWATWCVPCREEFPDRGVRLMLVSTDFDSEMPAVHRFLSAQGVDFPTFIKNDQDMRFIDGIEPRWSGALPATFLYDGDGKKLWFHEGKITYDTLKTRLDAALAAAPGNQGEHR